MLNLKNLIGEGESTVLTSIPAYHWFYLLFRFNIFHLNVRLDVFISVDAPERHTRGFNVNSATVSLLSTTTFASMFCF